MAYKDNNHKKWAQDNSWDAAKFCLYRRFDQQHNLGEETNKDKMLKPSKAWKTIITNDLVKNAPFPSKITKLTEAATVDMKGHNFKTFKPIFFFFLV